jgi:GTP-binding protein
MEFRVKDARYVASAAREDQLPPSVSPEIAFAGRSNVGKSSLMNMLMQRKNLVRTSKTPGATRAINLFAVDFDGQGPLTFVDLPGYGYAARSKEERESWGPLLEGYLRTRSALRALVVLIDARRGIEDDDEGLIDLGVERGLQTFVVATKIDKLGKAQRKPALEKIKKTIREPVIGASGETGEGREQILTRLLSAGPASQ